MNLPEKFEVLIITLSDRASRGEYEDLSGPKIREMIAGFFSSSGWPGNINSKIIPDDADVLRKLLVAAINNYNIILTTGGTGIGPGDNGIHKDQIWNCKTKCSLKQGCCRCDR
jgi:molybdopterin adenylyltransferase